MKRWNVDMKHVGKWKLLGWDQHKYHDQWLEALADMFQNR